MVFIPVTLRTAPAIVMADASFTLTETSKVNSISPALIEIFSAPSSNEHAVTSGTTFSIFGVPSSGFEQARHIKRRTNPKIRFIMGLFLKNQPHVIEAHSDREASIIDI